MRWLAAAAALAVTAACAEPGARPRTVLKQADSADQVIYRMAHYVTRSGVRRSVVEADTAYFYEPTQTYELRQVRVTFFDPEGGLRSTLTSQEGTYRWQVGTMEARVNVAVVSTDGKTLRTQFLAYDQASNRISTNQPFVYDAPGEHLEGNSFQADTDFRNVVTQQPKGTKDSVFVLPGQ